MSDELVVECGPVDSFGRRSVVARCGGGEYREQFNTDDAFRRRQFAEAALTKFRWVLTGDALARIDELIGREASAREKQGAGAQPRPRLRRLSDVAPRETEWLWPGRVALGAVTVLAGDPGLGKSLVTLDMAARVSRGAAWPDEMKSAEGGVRSAEGNATDRAGNSSLPPSALRLPPSSVLLLSAEDDEETTIRPRLDALGGDSQRIQMLDFIGGDRSDGPFARPFEIGRDLDQLTAAVEQQGDCRLVVIDPISDFLGRVSENSNVDVRRLLMPLAALAAKHRLAVVAVTHLRKEDGGAMYRTMGSMAFVAAARASWIFARDPKIPRRRLMLPVKNNLAADVPGLAFTIEPVGVNAAPVVCWEAEPVTMSIDAALTGSRQRVGRRDIERQQAIEWLREQLAAGPQSANDIRDAADAHGFSYATLRRAFRALGGKSSKCRGEEHGGWMWQLPSSAGQDAQNLAPPIVRALVGQGDQNLAVADLSALHNSESGT